jgi:hypothetical protein
MVLHLFSTTYVLAFAELAGHRPFWAQVQLVYFSLVRRRQNFVAAQVGVPAGQWAQKALIAFMSSDVLVRATMPAAPSTKYYATGTHVVQVVV